MASNVVKYVSATITAENNFTDWVSPTKQAKRGDPGCGKLNLSIVGSSFTGTVTLQRRFPDSQTAKVVETHTADTEKVITDHEPGVEYRVGVATGDFAGTNVFVRLGKQGVT